MSMQIKTNKRRLINVFCVNMNTEWRMRWSSMKIKMWTRRRRQQISPPSTQPACVCVCDYLLSSQDRREKHMHVHNACNTHVHTHTYVFERPRTKSLSKLYSNQKLNVPSISIEWRLFISFLSAASSSLSLSCLRQHTSKREKKTSNEFLGWNMNHMQVSESVW